MSSHNQNIQNLTEKVQSIVLSIKFETEEGTKLRHFADALERDFALLQAAYSQREAALEDAERLHNSLMSFIRNRA